MSEAIIKVTHDDVVQRAREVHADIKKLQRGSDEIESWLEDTSGGDDVIVDEALDEIIRDGIQEEERLRPAK